MKDLQELSVEELVNITGGESFFEKLGSASHKIWCKISSMKVNLPLTYIS